MAATTTITTIGAAISRELISPEMFDACTTMPAFTEHTNLVNKIALLQNGLDLAQR